MHDDQLNGAGVGPVEHTWHLPPQHLEAEEAILGAMMKAPSAIDAAVEQGLRADHFYRPSHRLIFDAIMALQAEHGQVDELTTCTKLQAMTAPGEGGKPSPAILAVGGRAAVMTLAERVPATSNAKAYAREVVEVARKRRHVELGHEIAKHGYDPATSADDTQEIAEKLLLDAANEAGRRHAQGEEFNSPDSVDRWKERYARLMDADEFEKETLSWGRPELDERLGRMVRGAVYVPAGWTKHGKSWWVLDVIEAACKQGANTLLHTAEMSDEEITERLIAMGGHDYTAVQEMRIPFSTLRPRAEEIAGWHRRTVQGKTTVARVKSEVMKAKLAGTPYRLVVIDHMGLLRPDRGAKFQPRREFVEDAVADLKAHAEEHGYTLLLVCQLSRPERTPGNHPRFKRAPFEGDLKEASGIEQIATCVIFVYRLMDPDTGTFVGQEAQLLFPFHRARPTPKAMAASFTVPKDRAPDGAYRFVPERPTSSVQSSSSGAPTTAVQEALEGHFGPVIVTTPDDIPF